MHGKFPEWRRFAVVTLLLTAMVMAGAGCATTHESDLPWNTPQSWEGSPAIPGMSGRGSGY